jgi:thiamine-monophosphate kinase
VTARRCVGEFELISAINELVSDKPGARGVRIGIGDDAALLRTERETVVTTDALVEGVHFERDWLTPRRLGARAFRVANSDIAAMGAAPRYILLSLTIPADFPHRDVLACVSGLVDDALSSGASLVGGNVSSGSALSLTLTVLGVPGRRVIPRSGARRGDTVVVTGTLGDAAAGVEQLRGGSRRGSLIERYRQPPSRLSLGRRLARGKDVTAMLDLSDGLAADLGHICKASQVSARVELEDLPVSRALTAYIRSAALSSSAEYAMRGEDYELLMTVANGDAGLRRVARACKRDGVAMTVIGKIEAGSGAPRVLDSDGHELGGGWDHLVN